MRKAPGARHRAQGVQEKVSGFRCQRTVGIGPGAYGKASIRFKNGTYTLVHEHFKPNRNAAIGRKMHF